ncbi:MAG: M56 family metallopeptidase [Candidatus Limiplasma sp.]|nr:M56 family metallopeptidase [Candidatus Limiplasma sp.]
MSLSERVFSFFHDNKGLPIRSMTVFNFLLEASLCGALLILLALLVRWLLRRKLGSRMVSLVWLLVAIRLLVPVALPNPLMNDLRPTLSTDVQARPIADQIRVRFQDATHDLAWALDTNHELGRNRESGSIAQFVSDISAYTSYGWTGKWFLFAYLAVGGLILCGMTIQNIRFRRRLKKHRRGMLSGEAAEKYTAQCAAYKVKPLPVHLVQGLPGPCLVGVLNPYIALPATEADPSLALARELCHYKAHDQWWGLLRSLCCIVHWFNPLVWIGAHCARTDRELACGERAAAAMTDEQRVSFMEAQEQRAARKSAPGILILSTMISMRGKGLKERAGSIGKAVRPSQEAAAAFAVLSAVVLLGSFFTAESQARGTDLRLEKAIYANLLDSPFPEVDEVFARTPVTAEPIASPADAMEQAALYLNTDFLGNIGLRTDLRYSVYHDLEGWYVAATSSFDEAYCFLLGEDGRILNYNCRVFEDEPLVNKGRLPINMEEAMAGYMGAFAVDFLGQTGVTNPRINEDQYDLEGRYLACQAEIAGAVCGFHFCVGPYPRLLQFYAPVTPSVMFTQGNVLYSLWVHLRDVLGITAAERSAYCGFTVEWLEDSARWRGTVRIPAEGIGEAALAKLQSLYGERNVYTLWMECDVDGNGSDALSALAVSEERDASTPVTPKDTTAYFDVSGRWLYEEETIPSGTPYTVLRTLTSAESAFEQEWAKGHTWLFIRYPSPTFGGMIDRWMLSPEEMIAPEPGAILDADGRPRGWRWAVLPDSFWDAMEEMGGDDWQTASALLQDWRETHGESIVAWPMEGQALWNLWMNNVQSSLWIFGLPGPGDVPKEKALEIARAAFEEAWQRTYPGQRMPGNLTPLVSYHYDGEQNYRGSWYVQYIDPSREEGEYYGGVTLDAQTGEVLTRDAAVGGHG